MLNSSSSVRDKFISFSKSRSKKIYGLSATIGIEILPCILLYGRILYVFWSSGLSR